MTLHDFITITRHIAQIEMKISINRPDAVCVSRHLYNMLKLQVEMQKYIVPQNAEEYLDRVNGLVVLMTICQMIITKLDIRKCLLTTLSQRKR